MTVKGRTGVYVIGVRGDIGTTLVVGAAAIARGLASRTGLVSDLPPMNKLDLADLDDLVFGGIDICEGSMRESAEALYRNSRTVTRETLDQVLDVLDAVEDNVLINPAFRWNPLSPPAGGPTLEFLAAEIGNGIEAFSRTNDLERVIVVNLASTEPAPPASAATQTLAALRSAVAADAKTEVCPGMLTALAAFDAGCAYLNFTPNLSVAAPALTELADSREVPYYGDDGKTGETLVKTALAPMFAYRNLQVMSWEGTNLLGNNDGLSLDDNDNRAAKLRNKSDVLEKLLGYPLHSGVDINYVPSLGDWKTAWDLVHFRGFLDVPMTMQFTWQGCDSILAAPLVLDMARLTEFAQRHGERGPMVHLAGFFKNPLGVDEMALYPQFQMLLEYTQHHLRRGHGLRVNTLGQGGCQSGSA